MARVAGVDLTHAFNVPSLVQREVDPTENDDENLGFSLGDEWFNSETGEFFKCGSAAAGKAAWGSMATVTLSKEAKEEDKQQQTAGGSTTMGDPPRETVGPSSSV